MRSEHIFLVSRKESRFKLGLKTVTLSVHPHIYSLNPSTALKVTQGKHYGVVEQAHPEIPSSRSIHDGDLFHFMCPDCNFVND
jgi:hypothetical protein